MTLTSDPMTLTKLAIAAIAGFFVSLPELTQLLVLLMVIDTAFGLAVAWKHKGLSAKAAWDGVTKKMLTLGLVAVAALLNPRIQGLIEVNLVQAASAFYIVPELLSITRNAAIMNVPVFTQFTVVLRYFQALSGEEAKGNAPTDPAQTDRPAG